MLGLIAEAPEPTPARTAYDDAREKLARLAEAEAAVRREGIVSNDTPCCDPAGEPAPCTACATDLEAHDGPADLSDDAWQDGFRWVPADFLPDPDDDEEPTFAAWLDEQAEAFATIGSPRASWLARQIVKLAEKARWLDAATPDAFDDRLEAQLDATADAAEACMASRCC
jgi:hypothetical protein